MKTYHKIAMMFPLLAAEEVEDLAQRIYEQDGSRPVVTFHNEIIDDNCTLLAHRIAKVTPVFEEFEPSVDAEGECDIFIQAMTYCVNEHMKRRYVSPIQRALIAIELENMIEDMQAT